MSDPNLNEDGVLNGTLRVGTVYAVATDHLQINLLHAGSASGIYTQRDRYGRGEVGEFVLVEGQQTLILGRLSAVKLQPSGQSLPSISSMDRTELNAIAFVQLLGTVSKTDLRVSASVTQFPRLGDRVYSAPSELIALIPELMVPGNQEIGERPVQLTIGWVSSDKSSAVKVVPEALFGRHCAILGATGGGKSWSTTRIIEECAKHTQSKVVMIDPSSEYRSLNSATTQHRHLSNPLNRADGSTEVYVPPTDFIESDFIAMFDPSGKVQGPKLREAMKSLRLAQLCPHLFPDGYVKKKNQRKDTYRAALRENDNAAKVDSPSQPFDVSKLTRQLVEECCWDNDDAWGAENNDLQYCSSLFTRIQGVIHSPSLKPVFRPGAGAVPLGDTIENFLQSNMQVLRLCLSDLTFEYFAREIIANVIGRRLMELARASRFVESPLLVVLDEAHNFLGKRVGSEDHSSRLDSFELIAKEGRKYGLNICLTTQRPRDVTEGVLSQMGTLLVHRLTNDRDRELVERACGDIDRSAAAFLPTLQQGEAALIGIDFPIPMTVQIAPPEKPPLSDSPSYQSAWGPNPPGGDHH